MWIDGPSIAFGLGIAFLMLTDFADWLWKRTRKAPRSAGVASMATLSHPETTNDPAQPREG